jgi:plastocyanin
VNLSTAGVRIPGMMRTMTSKNRLLALACSAVLVLGVSACGGDDDDDDAGGGASTTAADGGGTGGGAVAVTIEDFAFDAQSVTAGSSFEVENKDSAEHTFTADDGDFDVDVSGGETVSVDAPAEPGTYAFHCKIHSSMTGELEVT